MNGSSRALAAIPARRAPRAGWRARLRTAWPWLRRGSMGLFFAAVAVLLVQQARGIDWPEVAEVLRGLPASALAWALLPALLSHAVYANFDLVGRAWAGHRLPVRQVVPVTFVSYAFNLNLGSLVGGFAFRYRLYSRLGLDNPTITRVLAASLVTNWIGYFALAGVLFGFGGVGPPDGWPIGALALQVAGIVLLLVVAGYLGACAWTHRGVSRGPTPRAAAREPTTRAAAREPTTRAAAREWTVRGHRFALPGLRLALLQVLLSAANWACIGAVLFVLFQQKLPYTLVLGTLLLAAVAGVVAHIPAGLGVLEAVFIAMLGSQLPRGELLAGLIAYRAIYYLLPLLVAVGVYLLLEARASKMASASKAARAPQLAPPASR